MHKFSERHDVGCLLSKHVVHALLVIVSCVFGSLSTPNSSTLRLLVFTVLYLSEYLCTYILWYPLFVVNDQKHVPSKSIEDVLKDGQHISWLYHDLVGAFEFSRKSELVIGGLWFVGAHYVHRKLGVKLLRLIFNRPNFNKNPKSSFLNQEFRLGFFDLTKSKFNFFFARLKIEKNSLMKSIIEYI